MVLIRNLPHQKLATGIPAEGAHAKTVRPTRHTTRPRHSRDDEEEA